jgi:PAS domain S-box-containing protein
MSGGKSDDIKGKNIRHFLAINQAEQLIGLYNKVYSSGEPHSHEVLVHLEQGDTWFFNTLKPIDFGLSQIPAVLSVSIDITKNKKVELSLRESEEKFRRLVNTAPYGIQVTDTEGKILFSNPAHHKIQGYADGELVGKYIWELMADDHHRSETKRYYEKLIKEQPLPEVYFNRDLTKDGRGIDVQINWDYLKTQVSHP